MNHSKFAITADQRETADTEFYSFLKMVTAGEALTTVEKGNGSGLKALQLLRFAHFARKTDQQSAITEYLSTCKISTKGPRPFIRRMFILSSMYNSFFVDKMSVSQMRDHLHNSLKNVQMYNSITTYITLNPALYSDMTFDELKQLVIDVYNNTAAEKPKDQRGVSNSTETAAAKKVNGKKLMLNDIKSKDQLTKKQIKSLSTILGREVAKERTTTIILIIIVALLSGPKKTGTTGTPAKAMHLTTTTKVVKVKAKEKAKVKVVRITLTITIGTTRTILQIIQTGITTRTITITTLITGTIKTGTINIGPKRMLIAISRRCSGRSS